MKKRLIPAGLVLATTALLCGCQSNDLVFTTYTKVGLHISAVDSTPTSVNFGYKRFEGAIIPVNRETATGKPEEAASLYAGMAVTNSWLRGLYIRQSFATGEAAVQAAKEGIFAK